MRPGRKNGRNRAGLALAACAGAAGCAGGAEVPPDEDAPAFERVVNVEAIRVEPRSLDLTIRLVGVVQALQDVTVSAEETGVVRHVLRDKGTLVRTGEPILQLDDAVLRAQLRSAAADAEFAREMWQRRRRLYEEDGIGSEASYLEAAAAAERAQGVLEALQARLERATVTAPIDGVLEDRMVEVGTMVAPGLPVARIVRVDSVKVTAGVPERFALDVAAGAVAAVSFDVLDADPVRTVVRHAGAAVDPESRTFPVELAIPNPGRRIKPAMLASVTIVQERVEDALVVPQEALVSMDYGYVAFVVDGEGEQARARASRIDVVDNQGNEAVVGEGLNAGDLLVVVGQHGLTAGDRVRVVGGAVRPAARQ